MKKLLALLLVLTMVAALGTTAFADDAKVGKTVLKVAFNQSSANPEYAVLEKISDDLYDATEGRYSLEIYPDASLGDQAQTLEMVMIGAQRRRPQGAVCHDRGPRLRRPEHLFSRRAQPLHP